MQTMVITGGNSGIGKAIATSLAKQNTKIIIVNKESQKTFEAIEEIQKESGNNKIFLEPCDLSSLKQVSELAERLAIKYPEIEVLINNAGIELMERTITQEGLETVFTVNYLAPFLLTTKLISQLQTKKQLRIINTTSLVEKWGKIDFDNLQSEKSYGTEKTYYNSKLALLLFTYELARRFPVERLTSNAFEPGLTKTNFTRDFKGFAKIMSGIMGLFMKTPEKAAQTAIYLASSDELKNITGKTFFNLKEKPTSPLSHDDALAKRLWDETEKILANY